MIETNELIAGLADRLEHLESEAEPYMASQIHHAIEVLRSIATATTACAESPYWLDGKVFRRGKVYIGEFTCVDRLVMDQVIAELNAPATPPADAARRTNRELHEEAAGMNLSDSFFAHAGIDPNGYQTADAALADVVERVAVIWAPGTVRRKELMQAAAALRARAVPVDDICNAYESGVGHNGRPTANVNPYPPGTPQHTAYELGAKGTKHNAPAVPEAVARDARLGNRLYVWDYENPEDGSWDNIEEYLHDTTPNVGDVVRLNLALPLVDVVVEMLEVGKCGEPIRWEVRDVKTGAILSATDSEVKNGNP